MKPKSELTISYKPEGEVVNTPMIRITNKKIKEVGFSIGEKVNIIYEPGKITIKKKHENL